jgi:hypothetical protein
LVGVVKRKRLQRGDVQVIISSVQLCSVFDLVYTNQLAVVLL